MRGLTSRLHVSHHCVWRVIVAKLHQEELHCMVKQEHLVQVLADQIGYSIIPGFAFF